MDGVNKVCRRCQKECKQFAQVELVRCVKFQPRVGENSKTAGSRGKSAGRRKNEQTQSK